MSQNLQEALRGNPAKDGYEGAAVETLTEYSMPGNLVHRPTFGKGTRQSMLPLAVRKWSFCSP